MEENVVASGEAKVEKLGENGVVKELESKLLTSIDKYVKQGFAREETVEFLNLVSQYFAVTNDLGIDRARTIVSLEEIERDPALSGGLCLGFCTSGNDKENGDKIAVNGKFLNVLSTKFMRAKSLLTASVILVGHESTHSKQGITKQRAENSPWEVSDKDREYLAASSLDPRYNREGLRQALSNLSDLSGKKLDGPRYQILVSLGLYFGKTSEVDARNNGIVFCKSLYQNLLSNPEIENYPEVKKWIGKQDGMIGFHEKVEGFLDKNIISKYQKFVESCKVPNDKLVDYAKSQEQLWENADNGSLSEQQEQKLQKKFLIYDKTIRIALKSKSVNELEELASMLDDSTPKLKELAGAVLANIKASDKQNEQATQMSEE